MWLENLRELKKRSGMTSKQISDATGIPESTIKRIFAGDTDDPYVFTLRPIVYALGGSLDEVLSDTNVIISRPCIIEEKSNVEAENESLKQRIAELTAENAVLRDKVEVLRDKVDTLKDEVIATHNYYIKLK